MRNTRDINYTKKMCEEEYLCLSYPMLWYSYEYFSTRYDNEFIKKKPKTRVYEN